MTQKEKEIIDLIIENPELKQNEIADILNQSRVSVAVHISNLIKRNIILGRRYVINYDKLNEELFEDVGPLFRYNKKNFLFIGEINKYVFFEKNNKEIFLKNKLDSTIFKYIKKFKDFSNISILTNLNRLDCFDILNTLKLENIKIHDINFVEDETTTYYCVDKECSLKSKSRQNIFYTNDKNFDEFDNIITDDNISNDLLDYCLNYSNTSIILENNLEFTKNLFENKNCSNLKLLVANKNLLFKVFSTNEIDYIIYKLSKLLKIKKIIIFDELDNNIFIENDNILNIIDNIQNLVLQKID